MDYFKEANILYREERYDEAINLYKKAIEQNPDFVWHHCNLGLAFIEIGNYKEATNALEKACNIEPGISELNELLTNLKKNNLKYPSDLLFNKDQFQQQLTETIQKKLFKSRKNERKEENKDHDRIQEMNILNQAKKSLLNKEYDLTIELCNKILYAKSEFPLIYDLLGEALLSKGRLSEGRQMVEMSQSVKQIRARHKVSEIWGPVVTSDEEQSRGLIHDRTNKIVIVTCVWKRPELTEIVLKYYSDLKNTADFNFQLELLAVGSEEDKSKNLCESCGFDYLEFDNYPLSAKWRKAVQATRDYNPDGVIVIGSDDLISKNLIELYNQKLNENFIFFGIRDAYFLDLIAGTMFYWTGYKRYADANRFGETTGMGRLLSRPLLDKLNFEVFPELVLHRGLDSAMTGRLKEFGLEVLESRQAVLARCNDKILRIGQFSESMQDLKAFAVDIKLSHNITNHKRLAERDPSTVLEVKDPWQKMEEYFPVKTVDALKQCHIECRHSPFKPQ